MIDATCVAGVVTADDVPVTDAQILSAGVGQSAGLLLIEGNKAKYVTSNAEDISNSLTEIKGALDTLAGNLSTIADTLTAIGAGMTGPTTAPPPTLALSVASINADRVSIFQRVAAIGQILEALK